MPQRPNYPLATIEKARALYSDGVRVRDISAATGNAVTPLPSRGRKKLAARLFRAAERQAKKIERSLAWDFQRKEDRALDLQALRELTRILRDLSVLEDSSTRGEFLRRRGVGGGVSVEHEQALAVEGRAVLVTRTKTG